MSDRVTKDVSKRISLAIQNARLSYHQIARSLSVTPTTVWNWANGNSAVSLDNIARLAPLLNESPEFLAFGNPDYSLRERLVKAATRAVADVPEIRFGQTKSDRLVATMWTIPLRFFERTVNAPASKCLIYRNTSGFAPGLAANDYAVVDESNRDPLECGDGYFLVFVPFIPQILYLSAQFDGEVKYQIQGTDKSVEPSDTLILGKIVGTIQKSSLPKPLGLL